jgi:hypothetical protein
MTIGELLTNVVRNEGGLFVATADGYYDLKSGLILGKLLLDQSSNVLSESWQAIGAQLVLSALQLQDTQTRIPEVVVTTPGQGDRPEGGFYPEELGATVLGFTAAEVGLESDAPNSNVPAGAFVRSALPLVGQSLSAGQWKLTFQFPAGSAESILVVGLPPFDSVLLHGIRWRTDPQFQMYTDGWYYSASTQTLYVKIKHREEQEQLIINIVPQAQ